MCFSLAMAGQMAKNRELKLDSRIDLLAWALSMRTPTWTKYRDYTFMNNNSMEMITVGADDNIKTLTLRVVLAEMGPELEANGFEEDDIYEIIDEEVKNYVR